MKNLFIFYLQKVKILRGQKIPKMAQRAGTVRVERSVSPTLTAKKRPVFVIKIKMLQKKLPAVLAIRLKMW